MTQAALRTVFGVPLYNKADYLAKALDSLLAQTDRDFAILLVDDCSSDRTPDIAARYVEADERVEYVRNSRRLGTVGNWRRCYELARERHPGARYFAWGSDHDLWHPGWLRALVAELEATPEAVLAYPQSVRIDEEGEVVRGPATFDTAGITTAAKRLRTVCERMTAGSMVYGLYRAEALARAGIFRHVLLPDRLVLVELALQGEFRQVSETLWERRFRGLASRPRQRAAIFPGRVPLYAYAPPWTTHFAVLAWVYGVRGAGRPAIGRLHGLALALVYVRGTVGRNLIRRSRQLTKRRRRFVKRRRRDLHRLRRTIAARAFAVSRSSRRRPAGRRRR